MTKISDMTALTGAGVDAAADLIPIVDMSLAGSARNKKILVSELKAALAALFGTAATLDFDTDGTLAANSDAKIATQKAVKTAIAAAVTGLLDFKGSTDCSANPNYPAASKGDSYVVSVAGKIGGASGSSVDVGDVYFAIADNAGGTQAAVGASWDILEHNIAITAYTDEMARDAIGAALVAGSGISITVNDGADTITIAATGGSGVSSWKDVVRAATTVAGTLASSFENGDAIDGVTLATGDRILIKNQAAPAENGIYLVAASGAPTRATDADAAAELVNAAVKVSEGTVNADSEWQCTTNAPITLNTTGLTFAQVGAAASGKIVFGIEIDGGGTVITTGVKGFVRVPVAHTITKATVLSADAAVISGSIVIDVWRDSYANYPPTVADTIAASAKPTLSSATKSEDSTLTGWSTSGNAGDIYGFKVDSITSLTKVILEIEATV